MAAPTLQRRQRLERSRSGRTVRTTGDTWETGAPEIVDPQRTTVQLVVTMAVVVAGLALTLWALTDSLQSSSSVELPRLEVPAVQSLDIGAARAELEDAGFAVTVEFQPNEEQPKGVVIGQRPLAGSKVEQGELVVVLASDGPLGQSVPSVAGQQVAEATAALQAAGLGVEVVPTPSETVRLDEVLDTVPPAGGRVPTAGLIKLLVSSGPAPRVVPTIINKSAEQALADIGRSGLAVGKIKRVFRQDLVAGTVFEVDPPEGTPLPRDTPVSISVAGPEPTTPVPYLVGLHQPSAQTVLARAELQVRIVTTPVSPGDPNEGRVVAQGVPPQAEVKVGSVVEITVAVAVTPVAAPTTLAPVPGA